MLKKNYTAHLIINIVLIRVYNVQCIVIIVYNYIIHTIYIVFTTVTVGLERVQVYLDCIYIYINLF